MPYRIDESIALQVPRRETPPERPFGTFVKVRIETGSLFERTPISLAQVSEQASARHAVKTAR